MSDIVIQVAALSKQYRIGVRQEQYYTLRETLNEVVAKPFQKLASFFSRDGADSRTPEASSIWALKDVSFEVKRGDVVGIIGRNGAGKSTLLKILSRITEPTEGRVKIHGRVGSLLEVGTGFHPELTGRENICLNGAILGMKKAEIDRKFDEIVAFAEVEQFIDTPVKHYSSGMYLRLAFAVAAHLEPEILIVDEVLAMGDAAFQKKCLGKMGDFAKKGRTVLFVSHNVSALSNLCERGILLNIGHVEGQGAMTEVLRQYMSQYTKDTQGNLFQPSEGIRVGDQRAIIEHFAVRPNPLQTGRPVEFTFSVHRSTSYRRDLWVELAVGIRSEEGAPLVRLYSSDVGEEILISEERMEITVRLEQLPLAPGRYRVNIWMGAGQSPIDWIRDCMLLDVEPGPLVGNRFIVSSGFFPVLVPSIWKRKVVPQTGSCDELYRR